MFTIKMQANGTTRKTNILREYIAKAQRLNLYSLKETLKVISSEKEKGHQFNYSDWWNLYSRRVTNNAIRDCDEEAKISLPSAMRNAQDSFVSILKNGAEDLTEYTSDEFFAEAEKRLNDRFIHLRMNKDITLTDNKSKKYIMAYFPKLDMRVPIRKVSIYSYSTLSRCLRQSRIKEVGMGIVEVPPHIAVAEKLLSGHRANCSRFMVDGKIYRIELHFRLSNRYEDISDLSEEIHRAKEEKAEKAELLFQQLIENKRTRVQGGLLDERYSEPKVSAKARAYNLRQANKMLKTILSMDTSPRETRQIQYTEKFSQWVMQITKSKKLAWVAKSLSPLFRYEYSRLYKLSIINPFPSSSTIHNVITSLDALFNRVIKGHIPAYKPMV